MDEERFDGVLLSVAQNISQNHGGIDDLLDVFLGFLRRKTDAFNPPGGFPQLESSFVSALKRQYDLGQRALASKKQAGGTKRRADAPAPAPAPAPSPPPAAVEVPVLEMSADGSFDASSVPAKASLPAAVAAPAPAVLPVAAAPRTSVVAPAEAAATAAASPASGGAPADSAADADMPRGLPGNGGSTDRYTWTQTLDDLQVTFELPAGTRSRDVQCDIKAKAVKVSVLGKPLLGGALPKRVKADESYWTLDDAESSSARAVGGKVLTLYLSKEAGMEWWDRVADGEPTIDVTKIQPENSKLSDLDSGTRATVEKMMFDQRQKALGQPSSDELQRQEVLSRFMKAHPEMDFSQAKIS